mmetsp:Transcript_142252/g.248054  ORF Transcript_142252/g.248054 Transcript_142252/m.248054 type:complete len:227 (+) Transcript_142252:305-985(+)
MTHIPRVLSKRTQTVSLLPKQQDAARSIWSAYFSCKSITADGPSTLNFGYSFKDNLTVRPQKVALLFNRHGGTSHLPCGALPMIRVAFHRQRCIVPMCVSIIEGTLVHNLRSTDQRGDVCMVCRIKHTIHVQSVGPLYECVDPTIWARLCNFHLLCQRSHCASHWQSFNDNCGTRHQGHCEWWQDLLTLREWCLLRHGKGFRHDNGLDKLRCAVSRELKVLEPEHT